MRPAPAVIEQPIAPYPASAYVADFAASVHEKLDRLMTPSARMSAGLRACAKRAAKSGTVKPRTASS
ncbi:MAG: hypothetical protein ACX939_05600 [Hyphococcus sp.]